MPSIRPISDLRNYPEVLREVTIDTPVYLTKNGRGCYALLDLRNLEKMQATIELAAELEKGMKAYRDGDYVTLEEIALKFCLKI